MSAVDRAEAALRLFGDDLDLASAVRLLPMWSGFSQLSVQERAEVLRRFTATPGAPMPGMHAFGVTPVYPGGYLWSCVCGHYIVQTLDEMPDHIHARLLEHTQGRDGLKLCPTGCGRLTRKCQVCPGVTR